jgi:hypothetical protein
MQKTRHSDDEAYGGLYLLSILLFFTGLFLWRRAKPIIAKQRAKLDLKKRQDRTLSLKDKSKVIILMPVKEEFYKVLSMHINQICEIQLPPFSDTFFSNNDINCIVYFDKTMR